MAKNTRKAAKKPAKSVRKTVKKSNVLKVDSAKKIPKFELTLKNSKINFVLVYAEWCGACHKFMDNIWNPMCKGSARHNRMAVRDDMIKNTSLSNASFDYLPSILVVDENGQIQTFKTPEGNDTNAMPTPKNLNDMKKVVNVPVKNINEVNSSVINITDPANPKPILNRRETNSKNLLNSNSVNESVNRSVNESVNRSVNESANESVNGSVNRSNSAMSEMPNIPDSDVVITNKNLSKGAETIYMPTPMMSPKESLPKGFMRKFGKAFRKRLENSV
jgi:thiol-disulfide isomerase/thioredoxin